MALGSAQVLDLALPAWAGASFAAVGIVYQMAQTRKVTPKQVFMILAVCGTVFFAAKCMAVGRVEVLDRAVLLGIMAGIGQYLSIKLVGQAMKLGPFSLIWCILSLSFAPAVLYSAFAQGIVQPGSQWFALGVAALCCIMATTGNGGPANETSGEVSTRARLAYGLLLVVILVVNGLMNVSLQDLNVVAAGRPRDAFFLCMYVAIAAACCVDSLVARELGDTIRRAWWPGLLAGIGSVSGMISVGAASARTGPAAFLICSIVMLILPMLAAVIVFRERVTVRWIGTLILGLLAIVLANF